MLSVLQEMFSYTFIVRAILVGTLVALCSALLGVSLILKRYSMIGDGLSHVAFGALTIAVALNLTPLYVSIPVVIISAIALLKISKTNKINGDAAIAIISTVSIAIGIITTSLSQGLNTDVFSYMFGSILAMSQVDVYISVILSILVLALFLIFYNKIFAVTFDENFAKATGVKTNLYNTVIAILTAITIVVGMRIMGTMLISSLIIFPALTSMKIVKTFRNVIICSAIISVFCFFFGIVFSYVFSIPTGASIVVVNAFVFIMFSIANTVSRKI